MRFVTYKATRGLERFREVERDRIWRSTHKCLMRADAEYQRRVRGFHWRIWVASISFLALTIPFGGHFDWPPVAVQVSASLILTVMYTFYIVRTSFIAQEFQNEWVGKALHGHAVNESRQPTPGDCQAVFRAPVARRGCALR